MTCLAWLVATERFGDGDKCAGAMQQRAVVPMILPPVFGYADHRRSPTPFQPGHAVVQTPVAGADEQHARGRRRRAEKRGRDQYSLQIHRLLVFK